MIFLVIMLGALAATGILETRDGSRRAEINALVKESRRNAAWRQPEPIRRGRYAVWTPLPMMRSPREAWDVRTYKKAHDVAAS